MRNLIMKFRKGNTEFSDKATLVEDDGKYLLYVDSGKMYGGFNNHCDSPESACQWAANHGFHIIPFEDVELANHLIKNGAAVKFKTTAL